MIDYNFAQFFCCFISKRASGFFFSFISNHLMIITPSKLDSSNWHKFCNKIIKLGKGNSREFVSIKCYPKFFFRENYKNFRSDN